MKINLKKINLKNNLKSKSSISALVYVGTNFFNAALPFFLLPILTSKLSVSEYGLVSMILVVVSLITPLITIGVIGSISRTYYKDDEIKDFSKYIGNCLFIVLISFFLINLIFLTFGTAITNYSKIPPYWYFACGVIVVENFIIDLNLLTYRFKFQSIKFAINKMSQTIFSFVLTYLFVVLLNYGWQGVIMARLIVLTAYAIYSYIVLWKNKYINYTLDKVYLKNALMFGIPLLPHLLAGFIINTSDRIFISNIYNVSATGSYSVAYQIGSVIDLVSNSLNLAWVPWLYENLKDFEKNRKKIKKVTLLGMFGLMAIALVFLLLLPFILDIFVHKDFKISLSVIIVVVIGFVFQGYYLLFVNYMFYEGKTKTVSLITFSLAGLNLILNYFMITRYGIIGGAFSTAICFLLKFIMIFSVSNRTYKIF